MKQTESWPVPVMLLPVMFTDRVYQIQAFKLILIGNALFILETCPVPWLAISKAVVRLKDNAFINIFAGKLRLQNIT